MGRAFVSALAGQWAATAYCAVLSTLVSFALGRFLGPESFGAYSYILTMASLFAILQDGGFSVLLFRETAHPSSRVAPVESIKRQALGHCLLATAAGLALVWFSPLENKSALSLALAYYALFSVGNYLSAGLKGAGLFEREARWRAVVRTLTVSAVLGALFIPSIGPSAGPGTQPALLFAGQALAMAAALALPMAADTRRTPSLRIDPGLYKSCGAFLLISAATTIYFKSDIILLTRLTGDTAQVGQYAAAYRLIEAAVLFVTPLSQIFFRKLRVSMHNPADFKRAFRTQLTVMCALAASGTALAVWLGPWIIRLAFGGKYGPAEELCLWLLPSLLFILPNGILTQALIAVGREGFYAKVTVATAVLNIALNAALIPVLGAKGSALATVVTEAALAAVLGLGYLRRS